MLSPFVKLKKIHCRYLLLTSPNPESLIPKTQKIELFDQTLTETIKPYIIIIIKCIIKRKILKSLKIYLSQYYHDLRKRNDREILLY